MSNILISNGTCYTSAGVKLDSSFIPCGNDAFGHHTCCGAGDNCLADNSCFGIHGSGYGSFLTYWAGCSDPTYKDPSCPQKTFDQPWIALTLCDNSDGAWAPCSQSGNPSTLQPGSFCSCTDAAKTTVVFKDSNTLSSTASLPASTGESIKFFAGFTPTTPPASSSSGDDGGSGGGGDDSTSSAGTSGSGPASNSQAKTTSPSSGSSGSASSAAASKSASVTVSGVTQTRGTQTTVVSVTVTLSGSPSSTGSASQNGGKSSGLGTGAKAGIGVGAAIVAIVAIAALLIFLRRRKRRPPPFKLESTTTYDSKPPIQNTSEPDRIFAKVAQPNMPEADGQPVSEIVGKPTEPWTMRSELEGSPVEPRAPAPRLPEPAALQQQTPAELPARSGRPNIAENF